MPGGRICPHCKRYTSKDEARCIHCNGFLGPQWLTSLQKVLAENGLFATNLLVGLCTLTFFGQVIAQVAAHPKESSPMGFIFFAGFSADVLDRFGALSQGNELAEPWRMLTSVYLHFGLVHLIMNMAALYDFGRLLEPTIKWPRFLASFVLTGIIGFAVSTWWYGGALYTTAGASGAVFGVQGVALGQMLAAKDRRFREFLLRTIGYSVLFWWFMRTNQAAHMGGLFAGIAMGFLFGKESRPWHRDQLALGVGIVCYLGSIAAILYALLH